MILPLAFVPKLFKEDVLNTHTPLGLLIHRYLRDILDSHRHRSTGHRSRDTGEKTGHALGKQVTVAPPKSKMNSVSETKIIFNTE